MSLHAWEWDDEDMDNMEPRSSLGSFCQSISEGDVEEYMNARTRDSVSDHMYSSTASSSTLNADVPHVVPCKFIISLAFPAADCTKRKLTTLTRKRSKRSKMEKPVVVSHRIYHIEYFLLPEDKEPRIIDMVVFPSVVKLFLDSGVKTMQPCQEGNKVWVSWTQMFNINVTKELLKKINFHKITLRLWDTTDRISKNSGFIKQRLLPTQKIEALLIEGEFVPSNSDTFQKYIYGLDLLINEEKERPACLAKGYRSCPTVFLPDDALRQPDFKATIQALSSAIYYIIKHRVGDKSLHIFDERRHPFKHELNRKARLMQDPELHDVYRFVRDLFSEEHLTAECVVVTLIFVERLMDCKNIDLCPTNWRRILVGSALLAYEYWNKQAVWSMDYCQVINNIITVDDMNEIERYFLHSIKYDTKISSYKYARYYFDLLDVAKANNEIGLFEPFLQSRALNPEAISRCYQEKGLGRVAIKRSLSVDNVIGRQRTKSMLSKENEGL